jgi:hypothetical protein
MPQRRSRRVAAPRALSWRRCSQRPTGRRAGVTLSVGLILALSGLLGGAKPAKAANLDDIRQLEDLINAAGAVTLVSDQCPASHAGYYERDNAGRHRLVVCRNVVNLADVEAVWEVIAHESTHIMQACTGTTAIADESMPRTFRELRTMAPHYAKLIDLGYPSGDQRLEAEAFWMELQAPATVIGLFRSLCAGGLRRP